MDGTHLPVAEETVGGGHALVPDGPDALSRIISFGHALRTISEYLSDHFFEGAPEPTLAMMHQAYDRLADRRPGFSPEEFTLLVMSTLLGRCTDPEEQARFRRGAAAYILRAAPKLPDEYAPIVEDARRLTSHGRGAGEGAKKMLQERVASVPDRHVGPGKTADQPATDTARPLRAPGPQTRTAKAPAANHYARDHETLRRQPAMAYRRRRGSAGFALSVLVLTTIAAVIIILSSEGLVGAATNPGSAAFID